jgi:hypothetical protein
LRFGGADVRLRDLVLTLGLIDLGLGRHALSLQIAQPPERRLGGRQARFGAPQAGFGREQLRARLTDLCAEQARIDLGEQVALLHGTVEVRMHLHDAPGDLRADLYLGERLDRAGRLNLLNDVAALHLLGHEARRRSWRRSLLVRPDREHHGGHDGKHDAAAKPATSALRTQLALQVAHHVCHVLALDQGLRCALVRKRQRLGCGAGGRAAARPRSSLLREWRRVVWGQLVLHARLRLTRSPRARLDVVYSHRSA